MSVVAAVREMLAKGVPIEMALDIAEALELAHAPPPKPKRRQRARRDNIIPLRPRRPT